MADKHLGLRKATGNKFDLVIDAYMYAVAMSGLYDFVHKPDEGTMFLLEGDLVAKLDCLIRMQKTNACILGIVEDEVWFLREHRGIVIIEDVRGRVEIEWFDSISEALEFFLLYKEEKRLAVSVETKSQNPAILFP